MISKALKPSLLFIPFFSLLLTVSACSTITTTTVSLPPVTVTASGPTSTVTSIITSTIPASTLTSIAPPTTVTSTLTTTAFAFTTPAVGAITITGYITTEDDFAAGLGADTAAMVHMRMMAASGLGITRQKADGKWEFYYFSGTVSSGMKINNTWTFNGTGAQLDAWTIVTQVAMESPTSSVSVTVKGTIKGDTATNPGSDADGLYFPVITVTSITLN